MKPKHVSFSLPVAALVALAWGSGCDDRGAEIRRQIDLEKQEVDKPAPVDVSVPEHPLRAQLMPLLEKLYPLQPVPPVTETGTPKEGRDYELEPGVAAKVKLVPGLSDEKKLRAIVTGVAEADAWAYRPKARRDFADQVHRVKSGFGDEQKELIMRQYAQLHLLAFFNSPEGQAAVEALGPEVKPAISRMQQEYVEGKAEVWADWMAVKLYARRVVAGDEPFRSVLRKLKTELGQEEAPALTWEESMDAPFLAWAKEIRADEELLITLTDLRDMKDREQFLSETHAQWLMEDSPRLSAAAKRVKIDPELGFGVLRTDLGGGYNELTFVFSKKLRGAALKKAYLRSIIYGDLLSDFRMLATAGSDFAERDENNVIDSKTSVVPDKYVPLFAKCASNAAVDRLINHFRHKHALLADLSAPSNEAKSLAAAHKCVIAGAAGDIHVPAKGDDKDVEGPAPGTYLALNQMLARFESLDVNMARMASEKKTEEDEVIEDAEAALKRLRAAKQADAAPN